MPTGRSALYHPHFAEQPGESPIPDDRSPTPTSFALIIGGMKCGTTSLFELLAQHPEIAASRVKEPDFFADREDPIGALDDYLRLWDWDPGRHRVALEASTAYAKYPWVPDVPERIASIPGRFRFIYMVRDPIGRIQSQVRHGLYDGWGRSLDEELTDDLIDFSRYAMQLDRYTAIFPRQDILVLPLEELRQSPGAALRRVCAFLEVDPDHHFEDPEEARNTGDLYTAPPAVAALAKNRVARWLVDRTLPRWARHRLRSWVARSGATGRETTGRWRLNDDEVRRVRGALAEDMDRLRRHYGVRASWIPGASSGGEGAGSG